MDLALNLKTIRKARGLTQHGLAALSGVSRSTIALIECGDRPSVTVGTLTLLADALGVPASRLLATRRSAPRFRLPSAS